MGFDNAGPQPRMPLPHEGKPLTDRVHGVESDLAESQHVTARVAAEVGQRLRDLEIAVFGQPRDQDVEKASAEIAYVTSGLRNATASERRY